MTGGSGYKIDAASMTRAVQGFSESAATAKKTMSDLENELVATLSSYAGDQATAFWQLHTQLQEKMQQASNELDQMSSLVNSSNSNYNSGDSQAQQSFRTVASNLNSGGAVLNRIIGA